MQNTRTFTRVHARPRHASIPRSGKVASPYAKLAKKIFKRTHKQLLVYLLAFYIAPMILPAGADTLLLTLAYPALCCFLTGLYGLRFGFISHYLAIPVILFFPASLMFFKAFSFLYALCYLLIGFLSLTFCSYFRQQFRKQFR